jgi:hypothetical protein
VPVVAAIESRLPAAGLRARHLDPASGLLEQPDRGETHRGPEQVDQASDEQANPGTGVRDGIGGACHDQGILSDWRRNWTSPVVNFDLSSARDRLARSGVRSTAGRG